MHLGISLLSVLCSVCSTLQLNTFLDATIYHFKENLVELVDFKLHCNTSL